MPIIIPPGGTPAGAFVAAPVVDAQRPPGILADKVDPITGEILSLFTGLHPVNGAIQHQFAVRAGSGAAVNGGQNFEAIRKNVDGTDKALAFEARRIAEPFVRRGLVSIDELDTNASDSSGAPGDEGDLFLVYTNRMTRTGDNRIPVST